MYDTVNCLAQVQGTFFVCYQIAFSSFVATWLCLYFQRYWLIFKDPIESMHWEEKQIACAPLFFNFKFRNYIFQKSRNLFIYFLFRLDTIPSANLRQQKLEQQRKLIEEKQRKKRQQQVKLISNMTYKLIIIRWIRTSSPQRLFSKNSKMKHHNFYYQFCQL